MEAAKTAFLVARPLRGGGGGKGLATKKLLKLVFFELFFICSKSKIKHISYKGFFIGFYMDL